jgi:hypothetical protein
MLDRRFGNHSMVPANFTLTHESPDTSDNVFTVTPSRLLGRCPNVTMLKAGVFAQAYCFSRRSRSALPQAAFFMGVQQVVDLVPLSTKSAQDAPPSWCHRTTLCSTHRLPHQHHGGKHAVPSSPHHAAAVLLGRRSGALCASGTRHAMRPRSRARRWRCPRRAATGWR